MKRQMMAFLMAGALLLTVGIATVTVYATSDGSDERPTVVQDRQAQDRQQAADRHGGIGFTEGDTALPGPSTDINAQDGGAVMDDDGLASDNDENAGSKPEPGTVIKNNDPVEAGGLRGGVVLRDDPVQMGGAGGLCSPPHHDCYGLQSQVLAGGLRGGVVLNTDLGLEQ